MIKERIDAIPENDPTEMGPESDTKLVILESDPISQISQIPDSASMIFEGDSTRAIAKITESKYGHARRNSTGDMGIGIPYKSVKILSRYLATSTSSCHDYCKYGVRQDLDTKTPGSPTLEKIVEKHGKGHKPEIPVTPRKEVSSSTKKDNFFKQLSLPLKGIVPKPKHMFSKSTTFPVKEHSRSEECGDDIQDNKETATSLVNLHGASNRRKQTTIRNTEEMKTSILYGKKASSRTAVSSALHSVKKVLTRPNVSLAPKCSGKRYSSSNAEKFKNLKVVSHLKGSEDIPAGKTLQVVEPNADQKTLKPMENNDSSVSLSPLHNGKTLKHAQKGISPVELSPREKTLRRIQYDCVRRSPLSYESKSSIHFKEGAHFNGSSMSTVASSKSSHSIILSQYFETEIEKTSSNAKLELKSRPIKDGVVSTKDKDSPDRKSSFRKGKVQKIRHAISPSRRLKFKRRSLSDGLVGEVEKIERNLKCSGVDDVETNNAAKSETEKVVLKRQDVEEKKGGQSLLNNMIEETANKLAETRNSKVKVLVGAFEIVISLQDSKPVSVVDAC